jgi:CheY-like chemotaxis protein
VNSHTDRVSVLLVDDEPVVHRTIGSLLRDDLECTVECALDGPSALDRIRRRSFDAALIDVRMPEMDGLALLRAVRRIDPAMACIMISADANPDLQAAAREEGAQAFIVKPIRLATLIEHLPGKRATGNG